jgi:hypothetical protein
MFRVLKRSKEGIWFVVFEHGRFLNQVDMESGEEERRGGAVHLAESSSHECAENQAAGTGRR